MTCVIYPTVPFSAILFAIIDMRVELTSATAIPSSATYATEEAKIHEVRVRDALTLIIGLSFRHSFLIQKS
jgi:hypothetical protein